MRKFTSKFALTSTIAVALALTIGCDAAGNPSALVGRWIGVYGDDKGAVMDLLSDGTGIFTEEDSKGLAITWKTENGRFYMTISRKAQSESYKLQGSLLTFTDDEGDVSEWTKCKKDCQEAAKEYAKAKAEKAAAATKAAIAKVKKGSFTDSRDGKSYKTLKFGDQTWMGENLNYNADGSKCYNNSESSCATYGRLYAVNTAMKVCPKGWHLPNDAEWNKLVDLAGGSEAGNILRASSGWENNSNGVDAIGFSALPGGYFYGRFYCIGEGGRWWSATEWNGEILFEDLEEGCNKYTKVKGDQYDSNDNKILLSVRCVQD